MFWKRTKVETSRLPNEHIVWVHEGQIVDLGPASFEDFKLLAYVTQEAYVRLPARKSLTKSNTLSRVAALSKRMYDAAKLTTTS